MFGFGLPGEGPKDVLVGVVVGKAAFFLDPAGLLVAFKVAAPDFVQVQIGKALAKQLLHCFRDVALPPVGYANPVADFPFGVRQGEIAVAPKL